MQKKKEILVVDDQSGIRMLLKDMLENEGYNVSTAETGQETLDKIHKQHVELLIMDYKLPILDGVKVLSQLQQEKINIPTILMSGLVEEINLEVKKKYSFLKKVLAKPFDVTYVRDLVKEILG